MFDSFSKLSIDEPLREYLNKIYNKKTQNTSNTRVENNIIINKPFFFPFITTATNYKKVIPIFFYGLSFLAGYHFRWFIARNKNV
jgi:hypothetical protein